MNILLVGPFPPVINGVTVCNDYLNNAFKATHKVGVINTDSGSISTKQGDSFSLKKILFFSKTYLSIFKILNAQVVYITPGQTFWGLAKYLPFISMCLLLRKKYVLHFHGGYTAKAYKGLTGIKSRIFSFIISNANAVICLSSSLGKEMQGTFPKAVIKVVENFYDPYLIQGPPVEKDNTGLKIVYLSNLMKEKGILEVLDAALQMKSSNVNFKLHIAGKLEAMIEREVKDKIHALGANVVYHGNVNLHQKKELLTDTNVFVLPTYYTMEGQPISIIEAYVTSNIVVTTDQGGILDIADYASVVLVKKQDAMDLVEKFSYVYKNLSQLLAEAKKTKEKAAVRFGNTRFVNEIEAIFLTLK